MRTISGSMTAPCAPLNFASLILDGAAMVLPYFSHMRKPPRKAFSIASKPGAGRQLLQFLAVSPAQDDVIGFQSVL